VDPNQVCAISPVLVRCVSAKSKFGLCPLRSSFLVCVLWLVVGCLDTGRCAANSDVVTQHALVEDPAMRALHTKLDPTSQTKALAASTSFTEDEVSRLQRTYTDLKIRSESSVFDMKALTSTAGLLLPPFLIKALLVYTEAPGTGVVDVRRLTTAFSICCRGDQDAQARFCFQLFDEDKDGVLSAVELTRMLTVIAFVSSMKPTAFAGLGTSLKSVEESQEAAKVGGW